MKKQANTPPGAQPEPLRGQGTLELPGLGEIWLVWSGLGLVVLALPGRARRELENDLVEQGLAPPPVTPIPAAWAEPLLAYAGGEQVDPAQLPVDLRGSEFQCRVWQALRRIPRGSVRSYGAIANDVGVPRGMRAVGAANGQNPVAIVVPCHRVVGANLTLGGYSAGLELKRKLLALEGVSVQAGRVIPGQLELWG